MKHGLIQASTAQVTPQGWTPSHRATDEGGRPFPLWNDRVSLLLDLPNHAAAERKAARSFRAVLFGLVIGICILSAAQAALAWMDVPRLPGVATHAG